MDTKELEDYDYHYGLKEESRRKDRPRHAKNSFEYRRGNIDLRYDEGTSARDIIVNRRLFRVWHPEARGDKTLTERLTSLSRYPDVFPYVAIMPDYHNGESSVNGSVIPSENLLYINAIGGDIGCGMSFARLPLTTHDLGDKLRKIYEAIYQKVPTGRRVNIEDYEKFSDFPLFQQELEVLNKGNIKDALQQIGTLGGGNHFIEVQADSEDNIAVMIHTGSRAIGQHIRTIFMRKATNPEKSRNLFYLSADSKEGKEYLEHVDFATRYAAENRAEILRRVMEAFSEQFPELRECLSEDNIIDVPHNFISLENYFGKEVYVHRKGAIHVPKDSFGAVPGSMGSASYVVRGRGNKYSFDSCSHGAGRRMSRGQAFDLIRREEFIGAMGDVISRTDDSIVDEAPQAYKDINEIIKYQKDLIRTTDKLRPLASIKG